MELHLGVKILKISTTKLDFYHKLYRKNSIFPKAKILKKERKKKKNRSSKIFNERKKFILKTFLTSENISDCALIE